MYSFLTIFFATYAATQVTTFIEFVGVLNIITDVMLLVVPIPLFFSLKTTWKRKLKLYVLFTLGIFIVLVTVVRLPINAMNKDSQLSRTTWASTELLTATLVVNAPTLYGFWNKKKHGTGYVYSHSQSHGTGMPSRRTARGTGIGTGLGDDPTTQTFALGTVRHTREPSAGIMRTQEIHTTTEYVDSGKSSKGTSRTADTEVASNSSQLSILRDSKA
ncbi:Pth11-like integral membrane protein [Fusarium austroafricanum]|uniref:Pth11-like integral membrane protein n=1 Tax=Fusarium austroafricanum TaxID=2364996 RepID=A0A8H4P6P0_9HYPO|nr:Pth11-like integral membrane protein [Fusarium austroafricanum]